jgi:hypothetical protein
MSKQSILDDIKRLDNEIELEKRSFYSLKGAPMSGIGSDVSGVSMVHKKRKNSNESWGLGVS